MRNITWYSADQWAKIRLAVYLLWFNFILGSNFIFLCFLLIIIHYHTQKQRKIKFEPSIKLNHNIFCKIEQDNCLIIQQIVNETLFAARKLQLCSALQDLGRILAYHRISVMYGWGITITFRPYMGIPRICWIIIIIIISIIIIIISLFPIRNTLFACK